MKFKWDRYKNRYELQLILDDGRTRNCGVIRSESEVEHATYTELDTRYDYEIDCIRHPTLRTAMRKLRRYTIVRLIGNPDERGA